MDANHDDRTDERVSQFFSAAEQDVAPPDEAFLKRLREQSTEAFMATAGQALPPAGRYRIMNAKTLKWFIPIAAAAIVLLAVGVWPGEIRNGRAYAMTDVPELLRRARTLHIKGIEYVPFSTVPGLKQTEAPTEVWLDRQKGGVCRTSVTCVPGENDTPVLRNGRFISDGDYNMYVNDTEKSVRFDKVSELQRALRMHQDVQDDLDKLPALIRQVPDFKHVGREVINGVDHDIWEGVFCTNPGTVMKTKCWLAPHSGQIGRLACWVRDIYAREWFPVAVYETIVRDEEPPAGIFDTTPPAGYALLNTKETATVLEFRYEGGDGRIGPMKDSAYISFKLPDGSIILAWNTTDVDDPVPQDGLFESLVFGGPLPKLPIEKYGLELTVEGRKTVYPGRHLAHTRKAGQFCEWSIYIPDCDPPPLVRMSCYAVLQRFNVESSKITEESMRRIPHDTVCCPFTIENMADFDKLVRGAMVELSDDKAAPAEVTWENVMRLIDEARAARKAGE